MRRFSRKGQFAFCAGSFSLASWTARAEALTEELQAVRWDVRWHDVRWWEYIAPAVLLPTALYLRFAGPAPPSNWQGGVLFDEPVMDAIGLRNTPAGKTAEYASHVLFGGAMLYRVVDSALIPAFGYGDTELALNLSMIDLGAFSFSAIVVWGSQVFVGRTRPHCDPERADAACDPENNDGARRSFIAGHAATGFTAAGLTCMHHSHIPLYGGWGDAAACGVSIAAAVVNGAARLVSENHYPTDLLLGVAVGSFSGWFLPAALHYGFDGSQKKREPASNSGGGMIAPYVDQSHLGAQLVGVF